MMREHELMLGRHRDRAQRAAEREAAGVAHEYRGRRRVEPQEGKARADDRHAQHGKVARAGDIGNAKIFGEHRIADQVGDEEEGEAGDDHRHGRQAVEAVGEVDRIARTDHDDGREQDIERPRSTTGP